MTDHRNAALNPPAPDDRAVMHAERWAGWLAQERAIGDAIAEVPLPIDPGASAMS